MRLRAAVAASLVRVMSIALSWLPACWSVAVSLLACISEHKQQRTIQDWWYAAAVHVVKIRPELKQ